MKRRKDGDAKCTSPTARHVSVSSAASECRPAPAVGEPGQAMTARTKRPRVGGWCRSPIKGEWVNDRLHLVAYRDWWMGGWRWHHNDVEHSSDNRIYPTLTAARRAAERTEKGGK